MNENEYKEMVMEFCTPFCRANKFADQLGKEEECQACKRRERIQRIPIICLTCDFDATCGKSHKDDDPYCPLWKEKSGV